MVLWLRLCAPNSAGPGLIPGQGTRSQMIQLRVRMPQLRAHVLQLRLSTTKQIYTFLKLYEKALERSPIIPNDKAETSGSQGLIFPSCSPTAVCYVWSTP